MGYAIPMSDAVTVINELMNREVLKNEEKGYLGITGRTITETISETYGFPIGVYVAGVSDTGAAYKAGIKQGDVITKINGREVKTINEVQEIVNNTKAGTDITVTIKRSDDGEYKEKDVTVEAQKTVKGPYPDTEHVRFRTLPPVTYAGCTFKGGYEQINDVTAALTAWIEANGYEYAGPMFDIYHVSPHETSDPSEFVTEVCYPVRKK